MHTFLNGDMLLNKRKYVREVIVKAKMDYANYVPKSMTFNCDFLHIKVSLKII